MYEISAQRIKMGGESRKEVNNDNCDPKEINRELNKNMQQNPQRAKETSVC